MSWVLSHNGERFDSEEYPTKEIAIAAAVDALDLLPGDPFWVAEMVPLEHGVVAENVTDRIADHLVDVLPDLIEYTPNITAAAEEEFQALLSAWLRKHHLHPEQFGFTVENSEQHEAPDRAEVEAP